jgi:hypothetical protein
MIAGTTVEEMIPIYSRPHRIFLKDTATIHDFPFEVIKNSLRFLPLSDLVSASLSCRAWKPAAAELILSYVSYQDPEMHHDPRNRLGAIEKLLCGLILKSLVMILKGFSINHLLLDLDYVSDEYIGILSRFVNRSLSTLEVSFRRNQSSSSCFSLLELFFGKSVAIRNLSLSGCVLSSSIPPAIVEGFSRIHQLHLQYSKGEVIEFIEKISMPNLKYFDYQSERDYPIEDADIISAVARNNPALNGVNLTSIFDSSSCLLDIVKYCPGLKSLCIWNMLDNLKLSHSDILAISSLKSLAYLSIGNCQIDEEVVPLIFPVVGRKLKGLKLLETSHATVNGILNFCPNLTSLQLYGLMDEEPWTVIRVLKEGLKKLAILEVEGVRVRLGTDWNWYKY